MTDTRRPSAWQTMETAERLARLVVDARTLAGSEVVAQCEGCGAWLLPDDDFVSGDDVSGCWAAMTDAPSKRERPCYAYRVGKDDARSMRANSVPLPTPPDETS